MKLVIHHQSLVLIGEGHLAFLGHYNQMYVQIQSTTSSAMGDATLQSSCMQSFYPNSGHLSDSQIQHSKKTSVDIQVINS